MLISLLRMLKTGTCTCLQKRSSGRSGSVHVGFAASYGLQDKDQNQISVSKQNLSVSASCLSCGYPLGSLWALTGT